MINQCKIQSFLTLIVMLAMLSTNASCQKTREKDDVLVTETEAAEIAETAVAERSAGVAQATTESTEMIASSSQVCGSTHDTTFQASKTMGAVSYNQQSQLHWSIQCTNLIPQTAQLTLTGNGNFTSNHWDGDNQASGTMTITGLQPQSTTYNASGTYTRTGNLTGDLRNSNPTFNCVTTVTLANLTISKSSQQITAGSGTVTVTASGAGGQSTTLTGTLTFNGDGTATVVINGHTRTFTL